MNVVDRRIMVQEGGGCGPKCTNFEVSNGGTFTCDRNDYSENDFRCNDECKFISPWLSR